MVFKDKGEKMKKFSFVFVCFLSACAVTISACAYSSPENKKNTTEIVKASRETATEFVEEITVGWNLGNALENHPGYDAWTLALEKNDNSLVQYAYSPETLYNRPLTSKALIGELAAAGFNIIRVPITWYTHLNSEGKISPEFLNRVREVVKWIIKDYDLKCIIDVHHDTGTNGWIAATEDDERFNSIKERFIDLWEQIATYFKDYDDNLVFEGINEVLNDEKSWKTATAKEMARVNELEQAFVDTVRSTGSRNADRFLLVSGYSGCYGETFLSGFTLPEDTAENKLIYSAHVYLPQNFSQSPAVKECDEEFLDGVMDEIDALSKKWNVPVIIGEFACPIDKYMKDYRIPWAKYLLEGAKKRGIRAIWWDSGNHDNPSEHQYFRGRLLIDRTTLKWDAPEFVSALLNAVGVTFNCPEKKKGATPEQWNEYLGENPIKYLDLEDGEYNGTKTELHTAWDLCCLKNVDCNVSYALNVVAPRPVKVFIGVRPSWSTETELKVEINGFSFGVLRLPKTADGKFIEIELGDIVLHKGETVFTVICGNGGYSLDYVKLEKIDLR